MVFIRENTRVSPGSTDKFLINNWCILDTRGRIFSKRVIACRKIDVPTDEKEAKKKWKQICGFHFYLTLL